MGAVSPNCNKLSVIDEFVTIGLASDCVRDGVLRRTSEDDGVRIPVDGILKPLVLTNDHHCNHLHRFIDS